MRSIALLSILVLLTGSSKAQIWELELDAPDTILVALADNTPLLPPQPPIHSVEPIVMESPETKTPPVEITPMQNGVSVGYNLLQKPTTYTWGEWTTVIPAFLLGVDNMFNGGEFTQDVIDTVRGKSDDPGPSVDRYGDRDFAIATPSLCEAAALHSKDIHVHRSGESGSCFIDVVSPEEE